MSAACRQAMDDSSSDRKITKGMSASDIAIPGVGQSYFALGMVKQLSESKQGHLNQMCTNFIPQDRWHELANH